MAVRGWKKLPRGAAFGAMVLTLAACGTGTSGNNGQAPVSPPSSAAPAAPVSQTAQLRVDLDNGACRVLWNGRQVNGAGLLEAAVAELSAVIERAGGVSAVTEEMLVLGLVGNADTPWRCVGGAIAQVRRAGYASIALNLDPAGGAAPQGVSLPIHIDLPIPTDAPPPPVEPILNRVAVRDDGAILWNGAPVDAVTLRSYLELTRTMRPEPELDLEIAGQTRFDAALTVLAVIQRAGIAIGRSPYGSGTDLPPPEAGPPGAGLPPMVEEPPPPPGEQFELTGLERFIPDLR